MKPSITHTCQGELLGGRLATYQFTWSAADPGVVIATSYQFGPDRLRLTQFAEAEVAALHMQINLITVRFKSKCLREFVEAIRNIQSTGGSYA